ncbi:MAG: ACP S-malonyltransferase [Acidiferrobacteraceae bacterium]
MRLGFVFPGQGSQSIGMLRELAAEFSEVTRTFEEGSDVLGRDLWALAQHGPEDELNRTEHTQPVLLCADVACWRVWRRAGGGQPVLMAGHSLGEYAALVCAEALAFADAVKLVAVRGRLMQEAVPEGSGSMAAVLGLEDEQIAEICRAAAQGAIVAPVNYNAPGQVVIAGNAAAVARAAEAARAAGAKRVIALPVSVPSHCALMAEAAEALARRLRDVALVPPRTPVLHNVTIEVAAEPETIRNLLAAQLCSPVRWVDTVRQFAAHGVDHLIECGPGKVLAGLNRRIIPAIETESIGMPEALRAAAGRSGGENHAASG